MKSRTLATAVLLLLAPHAFGDTSFDPARSYAVVIGVLEWKDPSITSFAKEDRKDRELLETLVARGVKRERTRLLLDEEATLAGIESTLSEVAAKVGKDETLLVYYAGHGSIVEGTILFLNYDYDGSRKNGLTVPRLAKLLAENLTAGRLLLLADCCHSGGMAEVARRVVEHRPAVRAASLTSAEDSNTSTANWTFTLTLLDGLRGEPLMDRNGNGSIELDELSAEVGVAMKYRENQRHGFSVHGVDPALCLAAARKEPGSPFPPGPFARRQYVTVFAEQGTRVGRVIGFRDGEYAVQLQGYSDRKVVQIPPERLAEIAFDRYEAGATLQVLWGKRLWEAKVVRRDGDFHWITYPGWDSVWDEWVLSDRIFPTGGYSREEALARAGCRGRYRRLLRRIEVKSDVAKYGLFHEEGFYDLKEWGGHEDLPPGYWVYLYPHWYIFGDKTRR